MTRIELIAALAALIFIAMFLGWMGHLLWSRLTKASSPVEDRVSELAAELSLVEHDRDQIIADRDAQISELTQEYTNRETALQADLREREAELSAAMEGLAAARRG